jgi:hypothetical protein
MGLSALMQLANYEQQWGKGEGLFFNHRQLLRYEKNGLESAFGTKKKHILKPTRV